MTQKAARPDHGYANYDSWPHPKPVEPDPVDPRLVRVIRRRLGLSHRDGRRTIDFDETAKLIAADVWAWLAEGDNP